MFPRPLLMLLRMFLRTLFGAFLQHSYDGPITCAPPPSLPLLESPGQEQAPQCRQHSGKWGKWTRADTRSVPSRKAAARLPGEQGCTPSGCPPGLRSVHQTPVTFLSVPLAKLIFLKTEVKEQHIQTVCPSQMVHPRMDPQCTSPEHQVQWGNLPSSLHMVRKQLI